MSKDIQTPALYQPGEEEIDWLQYDHDERIARRAEFVENRSRWIDYCRDNEKDIDFLVHRGD